MQVTSKKLELIPVPYSGTRTEAVVYESNLNQMEGKEGDWVGIRYGGKKVSLKTRRMSERQSQWKDNLIWIPKAQRIKLVLPDIGSYSPDNPPQLKVEVWKHRFPREQRVYLAFATFLLGTLTSIFSYIEAISPQKNWIQLILALMTTLLGFISTVLQKQ